MEIESIPIAEIIPYDKNPRKNDQAVDIVAKSIKEFGFNSPIILDKDNVIIAGHTRLKAAQKLGMTEVPILWKEQLTEEQVKAYRIMDNRSGEIADWDTDLLKKEIEELKNLDYNIDLTGFSLGEVENLDQVNGVDNDWVGMPDFDKINSSFKIIIHFDKIEDREEFNKKYKFNYIKKQEKAWSLWYPEKSQDDLSSLKYE